MDYQTPFLKYKNFPLSFKITLEYILLKYDFYSFVVYTDFFLKKTYSFIWSSNKVDYHSNFTDKKIEAYILSDLSKVNSW